MKGGIGLLVIVLVLTFGYCRNIYKLVNCDFKPSYKAEVFHSVGIVTGLGAIFGFINVGK